MRLSRLAPDRRRLMISQAEPSSNDILPEGYTAFASSQPSQVMTGGLNSSKYSLMVPAAIGTLNFLIVSIISAMVMRGLFMTFRSWCVSCRGTS